MRYVSFISLPVVFRLQVLTQQFKKLTKKKGREQKEGREQQMVHHHRYNHMRKNGEVGEDEEKSQTLVLEYGNAGYCKRTRPKLLPLLFLFSLASCSLVLVPHIFSYPATLSLLYSLRLEYDGLIAHRETATIFCDRSGFRSDICFMRGDIRTRSAASSILLYNSTNNGFVNYFASTPFEEAAGEEEELQHENIKPYTRKWETSIMDTIAELELIMKRKPLRNHHECEVRHSVPAIFFSTGGYTGNVYHEFNDGIIPLYITSQHLNKQVVFVILDYRRWWVTKYGDILSRLSDYPPIDFNRDQRTHCFPEAIVGLGIHDDLTVDSSLMQGNKSTRDFRNLLDQAYWPRISGLIQDEERDAQLLKERLSLSPSPSPSPLPYEEKEEENEESWKKPKLVILSRNGSRAITNEDAMVELAEKIGFQVKVLRPDRTTELAKIYRALNASDVMIGVHGAAMTHFLFMRPGCVFIQVIPLGTDWAAQTYYGDPAMKLGLKYFGYKILPRESSLYGNYDEDDPVIRNPKSVTKKGWQFTKKIYLDGQNVILDLRRFHKYLVHAYDYSISKRNPSHQGEPQ